LPYDAGLGTSDPCRLLNEVKVVALTVLQWCYLYVVLRVSIPRYYLLHELTKSAVRGCHEQPDLSFWGADLDLTVDYRGLSTGAYLLDVGDQSLAEKNLSDLFSLLCAFNW
jgi:hypothetical protein